MKWRFLKPTTLKTMKATVHRGPDSTRLDCKPHLQSLIGYARSWLMPNTSSERRSDCCPSWFHGDGAWFGDEHATWATVSRGRLNRGKVTSSRHLLLSQPFPWSRLRRATDGGERTVQTNDNAELQGEFEVRNPSRTEGTWMGPSLSARSAWGSGEQALNHGGRWPCSAEAQQRLKHEHFQVADNTSQTPTASQITTPSPTW